MVFAFFGCSPLKDSVEYEYMEDVITLNEDLLEDPDYQRFEVETRDIVITQAGVTEAILSCTRTCNIFGTNRFNINVAEFSFSSYRSYQKCKRYNNGIALTCTSEDEKAYLFATTTYVAERTGRLWLSCDAYAEGCVKDLAMKMSVGDDEEGDLLRGEGKLAQFVDVQAGQEVKLNFYSHIGTKKANVVRYENIQLQYEVLTDFVPYKPDRIRPFTEAAETDLGQQDFVIPITQGSIITSEEQFSLSYYGKKSTQTQCRVVCFGDSITGIFSHGADYPAMLNRLSDGKIEAYNVGFSGCMWTDHSDSRYLPFSMNRLVDSLLNKDFSSQKNAAEDLADAYMQRINTLEKIDFNEIDVVTIFYGTNDFGYSALLACDGSNEEAIRGSVEGAVKYSITKLQEAYPHLRIIVLTPYWRSISSGKDSDIHTNADGIYLYEYSDRIEETASGFSNVEVLNLYEMIDINAENYLQYSYDGTHPTEKTKHIIAEMIYEKINSLE